MRCVRCHALDDQGLYWFEEPITYDNIPGYAQLARELKTPVQLGENFYGPRQLYHAVQAGAGDYVMPDLMRIGGVSGWLRAAAIAGAAGIPMSTHLYPEIAAHLMRVTETAHWLEWQDWADPILREPFALKDGQLLDPGPARPGHRMGRGGGLALRRLIDRTCRRASAVHRAERRVSFCCRRGSRAADYAAFLRRTGGVSGNRRASCRSASRCVASTRASAIHSAIRSTSRSGRPQMSFRITYGSMP